MGESKRVDVLIGFGCESLCPMPTVYLSPPPAELDDDDDALDCWPPPPPPPLPIIAIMFRRRA